MTLLGTQKGRSFPRLQESGGTGQARNTRPVKIPVLPVYVMTWALKYTLLFSSYISTLLLFINYHISHCSKNEVLLLSFYLLKIILEASFHNHCLFYLVTALSPPQQEWPYLPLLTLFTTLSSHSMQLSWIKPSPKNHYKANSGKEGFSLMGFRVVPCWNLDFRLLATRTVKKNFLWF